MRSLTQGCILQGYTCPIARHIDLRIAGPPRDQRQYDLIQQYLPGLILNTILKIVNDLGDPYTARPGLGGMTAYPPRAMATVCIVMEAERKTYRKMVGHLRNNRGTVVKIGLRKIPSKSTIARAYGLIPDWYLTEVHRRAICEISAGSVAGDSTGYSDSSFVRWYDVRTDSVKTKRGWVKLHSIILGARALLHRISG